LNDFLAKSLKLIEVFQKSSLPLYPTSQETCEGKITQLCFGFCHDWLVKNGLGSSPSISGDGGDTGTLARATQIEI